MSSSRPPGVGARVAHWTLFRVSVVIRNVPYSTPSFAEVPASPRSLGGVLEFTVVSTVLPRVLDFIASRPCALWACVASMGLALVGNEVKRQ